MKKIMTLVMAICFAAFMATGVYAQGVEKDPDGWYVHKNGNIQYFKQGLPVVQNAWTYLENQDRTPIPGPGGNNSVESSVDGASKHFIIDNYDNGMSGASSYGYSEYDGKVRDTGNTAAENDVSGNAYTNGDFDYSNSYFFPSRSNIGSMHGFDSKSKVNVYTDSGANLVLNGSEIKSYRIAEGEVSLFTINYSSDGVSEAAAGQSLNSNYSVFSFDYDVSGSIDATGRSQTFATRDNNGENRSSTVRAQSGNEISVRASGGNKSFGMEGSGSVAGTAKNNYNNSFAFGAFSGEYSYDMNDNRDQYIGWDGHGATNGQATTNISHGGSSMSVETSVHSTSNSCPTAE